VGKNKVHLSSTCFFPLPLDHIEFHAPIPAALPRRLHQPADGGRIPDGKLPNFHLPGDEIHGGDGLPEPQDHAA